jgi:hypothetical protein
VERFPEIRRGRYELRYWRHWCEWVPPLDQLALPGLRPKVRSGTRHGFRYLAVEWEDQSGKAVLRLSPSSYGLELWHRSAQSPRFHRHGVVGWQLSPVDFWLKYLHATNLATNCHA